ncbi:hypothetical protein [Streptomyces sp. NPDC058373]|uniref:hypothetical protein n=1 Tax=Streptomyces sp. NPDC058373 TaxID=3346465 RepID=UPI0036659587
MTGMEFQEALDYIVEYARSATVPFDVVWDCADEVSGFEGSFEDLRRNSIDLISGMIDNHVGVGYLSRVSGEDLILWEGSKLEILEKIDSDMRRIAEPDEFMNICWFVIDRGRNSKLRAPVDSDPPPEASFARWIRKDGVDLDD